MLSIIITLLSSFISKIAPFAEKYWKLIIVALLVVGSYWYVTTLINTIDNQANQINNLKVQVNRADNTIKDLRNQITQVNDVITAWNQQSQQQLKQRDQLQQQIDKSFADTNKKIAEIYKQDKPSTCPQAIQYLIDAVKEFQP